MSNHSDLNPRSSASKQYLTLDLLEHLCVCARDVAGAAFERGESLSDKRLFDQVLLDTLCTSNQLADVKEMLEGAICAANETYEHMTGGKN